jgi:hypothetical protein
MHAIAHDPLREELPARDLPGMQSPPPSVTAALLEF